MANEVTELINRRFIRLKTRLNTAPTGGSTDDARQYEIDLWLRDGMANDN